MYFCSRASSDYHAEQQLRRAMSWEAAFVDFMKEWTTDEENTKHMEVHFKEEPTSRKE